MHNLETAIGELYSIFSEKIPECRSFFAALSTDETSHSESLSTLYRASYEGHTVFNDGNIHPLAIQSFTNYVNARTEEARSGRIHARKALAISLDIEKSLLERTIFEHFTVSADYLPFVNTLRIEIVKHVEMIKKMADKYGHAESSNVPAR